MPVKEQDRDKVKEDSRPKKKKEGQRKNRAAGTGKKYARNVLELRLISLLFSGLMIGMLVFLGAFTATSEQDMINNSYNSRQQILLSRNFRGTIFSADGEVLAETVLDGEENEKRSYPYKNLFSHIVGYSSQGRMGVEALANYYLINTNIALGTKIQNDVANRKNPGDNVYTTLNVELQKTADRQLSIYRGAVVVTEVKTGRLLAMVSHPDFDPNEISEIWEKLVSDKSSSVLLNRATQGLYPPGSTFKILTALEYYRENPDACDQYGFQCNGMFTSGSARIRCNRNTHHGHVDFISSFARSCNSSFANMGSGLDRSSFSQTLQSLLFGKELPLTLTHSKSSFYLPEGDDSVQEMMQTSIGQGKTQITPMHLNMITSAIANNGVLMKPYVIEKVVSADGQTVKKFLPSEYGRLLSQEEAELLQTMMKAVVERGTATYLKGLDYTAAGKTGSAEYSDSSDQSHAWFTGFAPAEDPQISVTIIVEGAGTGGDYAVPIAKNIFDIYFHQIISKDRTE